MDTAELLLYSIAGLGIFVVIGWFLCLIAIGKVNGLRKDMARVYGQETDIKKRIEQYIAKKASDELGRAVEGYKEGLDLQSNEVIKAMEEGTKQHLDSLGKFILQQEALIGKQVEYIIGAIVKKAQEDIAAYKQNQLEGIDAEVKKIVDKVAPEVLGKALSLDEHEDLVWRALERAKKEGLFIRGAVARGPATDIAGPAPRHQTRVTPNVKSATPRNRINRNVVKAVVKAKVIKVSKAKSKKR